MTTLVLGGTGFIGKRAVPRLVQRGEKVVVMDINPGAADFSEFRSQVEVIRGDIMQFQDVVTAIMHSKPDRIMNLAYLLGSGDDTPHFTMKLNILGMDNSFEAARICGVKRVTYASSIAVSGQQSNFGDMASTKMPRCTGRISMPCTSASTNSKLSSSTRYTVCPLQAYAPQT